MLPITIRKRTITSADLDFIQNIIFQHWDKGRTNISKILCQEWNWVQPNGRLKDMACREILLTLYRKGLISYPPGVHDGNNKKRNQSIPFVPADKTPLIAKLSDLETVEINLVRNTELETLYNSLVQEHHYLGFCQIVGNHLKYMAFIGPASAGDQLHGQLNPEKLLLVGIKKPRKIICTWLPITPAFLSSHGSRLNAWLPKSWLSMLKEFLPTGMRSIITLYIYSKLSLNKIDSKAPAIRPPTGSGSDRQRVLQNVAMIIWFTVKSKMCWSIHWGNTSDKI